MLKDQEPYISQVHHICRNIEAECLLFEYLNNVNSTVQIGVGFQENLQTSSNISVVSKTVFSDNIAPNKNKVNQNLSNYGKLTL